MSAGEHNLTYVKRTSQRGTHFYVDAKVSADGVNWEDAGVSNLSSGGLLITTNSLYAEKTELMLDLVINGFLCEFAVKTKGTVVRTAEYGRKFRGGYFYGVAFKDLPSDIAARIDENVINDRPVSGAPYHAE